MTTAPGEVVYRPSRLRTVLAAWLLLFTGILVVQTVIQLVGHDLRPADLLAGTVAYSLALALVFVLFGAARGWTVRTTPDELVLTPPRSGVAQALPGEQRIAWDQLAGTEFRYRWLWRSLVVRPTTGSPVLVRTAFLRPSQEALAADLARRMAAARSAPELPRE